ncbi:glycosyltransferase family 9 protein [Mucilaginibacter litoreus]|uniref:Glycosyltransferase family 9 protein n=1 Tax=Mucilaginibacter litoreus TaxID=1048221 RepID=A0ABW3AVZ3_9SPHI
MKILIRLPNWLGDIVMSTAFISAVKQQYPTATIDIVIKKELAGIAAFIVGINHIHLFSKQEYKGLGGAYRFGKALKDHHYDLYFNLPQSLSSLAMAWASGTKKRIGYAKEGGIFLLTNAIKQPKGVHRVDEYLYLLEKSAGAIAPKPEVSLNGNFSASANNAIVNFNSEASSRRMPVEKGKSLINSLTSMFKTTQFVFVGSFKEAGFIESLLSGLENQERLHNYAGKTDLKGLAELISQSKVVLTTDSGPAHLANALNVPVVVLFGAGNELNTAPYNPKGLNIIRAAKLDCEPCVRNVCKLYGVPKCMQLLDENKIINALSLHLDNA